MLFDIISIFGMYLSIVFWVNFFFNWIKLMISFKWARFQILKQKTFDMNRKFLNEYHEWHETLVEAIQNAWHGGPYTGTNEK